MITTYNLINDINRMRGLFDNFFSENAYLDKTDEYSSVNLYEKDDEIEIVVLAPGLKAEDINLELADGRILIETDKKNDYSDQSYIRRERTFGTNRKSVELPYKVDPDKIDAGFKDGILTIRLVKDPDAKPKKITIK